VPVHRNGGLRKICGCPRRLWAKCPHGWHLNFQHGGRLYRFGLGKYVGHPVITKTDAEAVADRIRTQIREGLFKELSTVATEVPVVLPAALTFGGLADIWSARRE